MYIMCILKAKLISLKMFTIFKQKGHLFKALLGQSKEGSGKDYPYWILCSFPSFLLMNIYNLKNIFDVYVSRVRRK